MIISLHSCEDRQIRAGKGSYKLNQGRTASTGYGQAAWMLRGTGAELSPPIDISACNKLQFYIKSEFVLGATYGPNIHLDDSSSDDWTSMPAINTTWTKVEFDLRSKFSGLNLTDLRNFRLATEWVTAMNNSFWVDEIQFIDTIPPQMPTNIQVNGIKLTNNFKISKGFNYISATVYSNEPLDKSLEAVFVEYRKNAGPWKIIGFDYNTDRKNFTNVWNTVDITGTSNIDLRISSMDSTSNRRSKTFTGCSIKEAIDSFSVTLSNVDVADTISFGNVSSNNIPKIAQNSSGLFSFACIEYDIQSSTTWKIIVYTDNTNAEANPRYKGPFHPLYGDVNDGSGLIGNGNKANSNHSTPIKIWCDAKYSDGKFARAPCDNWLGSKLELQGVPAPFYQGGETKLYWKNQDLNGNGTNDNTFWDSFDESTYNYDANGDGDKSDTQVTLGKVFEYSCWRAVTGDNRVITDAQTPVIMDNTINSSVPGKLKVYFAITDDLAGEFKSNQLIFELIIQ